MMDNIDYDKSWGSKRAGKGHGEKKKGGWGGKMRKKKGERIEGHLR